MNFALKTRNFVLKEMICAGGDGVCSREQWHEEQLVFTEVEFEWIRQFYVQGESHARLHKWWMDGPMDELCDLWKQLQALVKRRIAELHAAADGGANALAAVRFHARFWSVFGAFCTASDVRCSSCRA